MASWQWTVAVVALGATAVLLAAVGLDAAGIVAIVIAIAGAGGEAGRVVGRKAAADSSPKTQNVPADSVLTPRSGQE